MSNLMTRLLDAAPAWQRRFSNKFLVDTVGRMNALVAESGMSRTEIAERAGWKEPYLSRVLSGKQNLTLRSLARFEEAVGGDVLVVADAPHRPAVRLRMSSEASAVTRFAARPAGLQRLAAYDADNDYSFSRSPETT